MLNVKNVVLLAIILIATGCTAPKFIEYNSEANLKYASYSNNTSMLLMDGSKEYTSGRSYAVVDCKDLDATEYLLIVPSLGGMRATDIHKLDFSRAVTLKESFVKELLDRIKISINLWNEKTTKGHGISYEYTFGKEETIEIGLRWIPAARYYFQNDSEGPMAVLVLGLEPMVNEYRFLKIEEVKDFQTRLQNALDNHEFTN